MNDVTRAQELIGNDVYDRDGTRIGRVGNVYVDDATHQPEWVTVRTGLFGMKESFVPLTGSSTDKDRIDVEVARHKVREAPRVDAEHGHLSDEEGRDLYVYYGLRGASTPRPRTAGDERSESPKTPSGSRARPAEAMTVSATGRHHRSESGSGQEESTEHVESHGDGKHHKVE